MKTRPASETVRGDLVLGGIAKTIKYGRRLDHFLGSFSKGQRQGYYLPLTITQRLLEGGIASTVFPLGKPAVMAFPDDRYIGISLDADSAEYLLPQVEHGVLDGLIFIREEGSPVNCVGPVQDSLGALSLNLTAFLETPRKALACSRILNAGEIEVLKDLADWWGQDGLQTASNRRLIATVLDGIQKGELVCARDLSLGERLTWLIIKGNEPGGISYGGVARSLRCLGLGTRNSEEVAGWLDKLQEKGLIRVEAMSSDVQPVFLPKTSSRASPTSSQHN